ncbi:uncharacterized protein LOC103171088 isoform X3 [Ornithorhynchus anatinus]|uniref:uncharacterized protein LOC103171088 isoform X3 n=1 Tax=Ornithorhynchus anatinus TaxID=9258 RepID=UPI0010A8D059|nr:uncharacterized protein LOC103171088 isoform X3 [Ornithorhynchus anatinus]
MLRLHAGRELYAVHFQAAQNDGLRWRPVATVAAAAAAAAVADEAAGNRFNSGGLWPQTQLVCSISQARGNEMKNDSGIYKAVINLDEQKARKTKLDVLEPVSLIQVRSSTRRAGSVIELSCGAKGDSIDSFEWKKDGQPLPAERCYQLPGNRSVLFIMEGKKLDCGIFSCNASNEISWLESSLSLIIEGISPSLHLVQNLCATTLILVVVVGAGFIVHHYQVETHGSDERVIRYFICIHGLLALSAILLFSAAVKWMEEKGPSAVFILLTLALIGVAVVAFTMFMVGACHPEKFPQLQTKKSTHIILDFITRGGVILLLASACFLITNIQELQGLKLSSIAPRTR